MKHIQTDVAIIGTGTAGMAAYRSARQHTDKIVLIEGGAYGTTCARVGCMPSKLLIAAAEAAHAVHEAPRFGIQVPPPQIDGAAVMARVRNERDRFVGFVLESVDSFDPAHRLVGYARFIDDYKLQVDDHTEVTAKSVVIATGSSPVIPSVLTDLGDRLVVNDHVFDWEDLPESVAVVGPGVIGLELGQALHRLGVRVKIFGHSHRVTHLTDPVLQAEARDIFMQAVPLEVNSTLLQAQRVSHGIALTYRNTVGESHTETYAYVLAATGRRPNTGRLGLENTSLVIDEKGFPVFNRLTMQCGQSALFIAGDANHELTVLHEAADEGHIAGQNAALYPLVQPGPRRTPINIVFSDPQVAQVGDLYRELPHDSFVTGRVSFVNQGRSRVMLKNQGALHVYADKLTGRFLGAEMIGPRVEHLAHLLSWAHQQQLTIAQMLAMPFYHPVIEEGVRTALREANRLLDLNG